MDTLLALDEDMKQIPNINLGNQVHSYEFALQNGNQEDITKYLNLIMKEIENDSMAPYYLQLCSKFSWTIDEEKLNQMRFVALEFFSCSCILPEKLINKHKRKLPNNMRMLSKMLVTWRFDS
jgi:hypothetical protein